MPQLPCPSTATAIPYTLSAMPSTTTNGKVIFNEKISSGYPVPGKTVVYDESEQLDLSSVPLDGGFLVKTIVLSVDPYMRGLMSESPDVTGFALGSPTASYGIGRVLRSESPQLKTGDHVYGFLSHEQYSVHPSSSSLRKIEKSPELSWSTYLGAAGMPGLTAYSAWKEYALSTGKGLVAFVTAASGPVGSMVVQLAKADGYKVIASAGSDDKVEFTKKCGADVAFNYKTTSTADVLKEHGPIDLYWDNVGGQILETALAHANMCARFIECGMISSYNGESYGPKVSRRRTSFSPTLPSRNTEPTAAIHQAHHHVRLHGRQPRGQVPGRLPQNDSPEARQR